MRNHGHSTLIEIAGATMKNCPIPPSPSTTPIKQYIAETVDYIKVIDQKLLDQSITVREYRDLIKQRDSTQASLNSLVSDLAFDFISFMRSDDYKTLFPQQHCPIANSGIRSFAVRLNRICESKKAIVLILTRNYDGETVYRYLLVPFDYLEDRDAYIKRRADYMAAMRLEKLKEQLDETNEKIRELDALRIELEKSLREDARRSGLVYHQRNNNVTVNDYSHLKY